MKNKKPKNIVIYADGGARGNPGPAAIGVVLYTEDGRVLKQYSEAIGEATNNAAEYEAVIFALKKAKQLFGKEHARTMKISFMLDSELVAKQLSGEYKIETESLFPRFIAVHNLSMDFEEVSYTSVPREKNKEADRLVNEALDAKEQEKLL